MGNLGKPEILAKVAVVVVAATTARWPQVEVAVEQGGAVVQEEVAEKAEAQVWQSFPCRATSR
jgi:hypothetical protein